MGHSNIIRHCIVLQVLHFVLNEVAIEWVTQTLHYIVGAVVQWLDYLAVTQEPGVRFPATAEKCHLMWRCPSGHGIN